MIDLLLKKKAYVSNSIMLIKLIFSGTCSDTYILIYTKQQDCMSSQFPHAHFVEPSEGTQYLK